MSNGNTPITTKNQATDLINFKILLNGAAIQGEYRVVAIDVMKCFNKISTAKITLADGDPAKQDFEISSKDDALTPGNKLEIQIGYHAKANVIFKGIIVSQAIKSHKGKHSLLTIEAKDNAIKLSIGRQNHCFIDKTDAEIIETIAKSAGFSQKEIDIDSTI
jgi:phage protein D